MNNTCNHKNIRTRSSNGLFIGMAICAGVSLAFTLSLTLSVQASSLHSLTTLVPPSGASATAILTISVTNASDTINGDVSNIPSLLANPGPDGISFREALMAANGTSGPKALVFQPSLKGASITPSPANDSLLLASGNLTITGDIDHDGQPDITLDGHLGQDGTASGAGLRIVSDHNTIQGLRFSEFAAASIGIACPDPACGAKRFVDNRILDNLISSSRGGGIGITPLGLIWTENAPLLSDILFQDVVISGNTISTTNQNLYIDPAVGGGKRNRLIGLTISNNRLHSDAEVAVDIIVADVNSAYFGIPGPLQYSEDSLIQNVIISDNTIEAPRGFGIHIIGANYGNSNNQLIDLAIIGNTITNCRHCAVELDASDGGEVERGTNNNLIRNVVIQNNIISQVGTGLCLSTASSRVAGVATVQKNRVENVTIDGNTITDFSGTGISLSNGSSDGTVITQNMFQHVILSSNTLRNTIEPYGGFGISIQGGAGNRGPAVQNSVFGLSISQNRVSHTNIGLSIVGGLGPGAQGNQVFVTQLDGNDLENNNVPREISDNIEGASGNIVSFMSWWRYLPIVMR